MYKRESLIVNNEEVFRANSILKITIKKSCDCIYFEGQNKPIIGRLERGGSHDSITLDVSKEFLNMEVDIQLNHIEKIEMYD
jgi:hypothetical protein